jgi:hypothetical protein
VAIRTVRLDEKEEEVLREIRQITGLPISEVLKKVCDLCEKKSVLRSAKPLTRSTRNCN